MTSDANFINHITIAGDESWSMHRHRDAFVKAYDNLVAHLAERSKVHGQETRITTYLFNSNGYGSNVRCVVWDKDVLRMPSIASSYAPSGGTPLVDAALLAIEDLKLIPQKYGSHAFLTFVLTDGEENRSRLAPAALTKAITGAPENHTYAAFVPDQMAVAEAKRFGFPKDNISVWDTSDVRGTEEVGEVMRAATDTFMEGRERGVHGYNAATYSRGGSSLFQLRDFKAADIQNTAVPLTRGSYWFMDVKDPKIRIDEFYARETGHSYVIGKCFYEFMKTESIQPQKTIAVQVGDDVFTDAGARQVLGLPSDHAVRVRPDQKPGCTIFIQSTSYNRNLIGGTRLLALR